MRNFLVILSLLLLPSLAIAQKDNSKKTERQKQAEAENAPDIPIQKLVKDFEKEVESTQKKEGDQKKKKKKKSKKGKDKDAEEGGLKIFDTDKESEPIEPEETPAPKVQRKVIPKLKLNSNQIAEYSFYGSRPEKDIFNASLNVTIPASRPGKLDKVRYEKGEELIKYGFYDRALAVFLRMHQSEPENSNINYKIGFCYMHSYDDRTKAIPYLKKALKNVNKNYSSKAAAFENNAPIDALYYLAKAHHLNGELKQAQRELEIFVSSVKDKHELFDDAEMLLTHIQVHKELEKNPKNYGVQNAGKSINSVYADYGAVPVGSDPTIYFTSHRVKPDGSNTNEINYYEARYKGDIYRSGIDNFGKYTDAELVSVSTNYDERVSAISSSEEIIYYHVEDKENRDLYTSTFAFGDWQLPYELFPQTYTADWDDRFAVSFDGKFVIFSSNRKGGFGGYDLYYTQVEPNGEWSEPINLGEKINSPNDERYPFLHPNGEAMYYSTNGIISSGGYDIVLSKRDPFGEWLNPVNVGKPINTPSDDIYFSINTDGSKGYYSTRDHKKGFGDFDIFVINFLGSNTVRPKLTSGFDMNITNEEGSDVIEIANTRTGMVDIYKPNVRTGKVAVNIDPCTQYEITFKSGRELVRFETFFSPCDFQEPGKSLTFNPLDEFKVTESTELAKSRVRPDNSPVFSDPSALNYNWQVLKNGKPYKVEGLEVNYLNKNGYIMHSENLDASGRFDFHLIPINENYIFEIQLPSGENCADFKVVLLRNYSDIMTQYTYTIRCFE